MGKKKLRHKEINGLSIHNVDCINHELKEGWRLISIHYIDNDWKVLPNGCYSNRVRAKFVRNIKEFVDYEEE